MDRTKLWQVPTKSVAQKNAPVAPQPLAEQDTTERNNGETAPPSSEDDLQSTFQALLDSLPPKLKNAILDTSAMSQKEFEDAMKIYIPSFAIGLFLITIPIGIPLAFLIAGGDARKATTLRQAFRASAAAPALKALMYATLLNTGLAIGGVYGLYRMKQGGKFEQIRNRVQPRVPRLTHTDTYIGRTLEWLRSKFNKPQKPPEP